MNRYLILLFLIPLITGKSLASSPDLDKGLKKYISLLQNARVELGERSDLFVKDKNVRKSGYEVVSQAIRIYQKQSSHELLYELIRYSSELSLVDPDKKVGKYMLPLWKMNPRQIIELTAKLPKNQRLSLRKQIKAALDESRSE